MALGQLFRICSPAVRHKVSRLSTAILLGFLAITGACTGSVNVVVITSGLTAGTNTRFAYVANRNDNTLSIFIVDTLFDVNGDKGQMRHNGYVVTGTEPVSVAADPSGSFVYVANSGDDSVSAYAVDEDNGRLTEVAGSPFSVGMTPMSVSISPSGTFIFVANSGGNTVSVFSVDSDTGVLTEVMNSPFATGANPTAVATSAGDGLIFVANTDDSTVSSFSYDPSVGELTEVTGSPFMTGSGPTSIAVNSTGSIAYVTNFLGGTVSAFAVSNKGQLAELGSSPYLAQNGPFSVTVAPSGRFAYVTNFDSNNVSGYTILGDGSLMEIVGSPFFSGIDPISFAIDLSECSAVAVNSGENSVSEFTIDTLSGELLFDRIVRTRVAPASIAMAAGIRPVTFEPTFAYFTNFASDDIGVFSIDPLDGGLTEIPNSPFVVGSIFNEEAIALDPLGEFAYCPNGGSSNVTAFRIEADGGLTELLGLPFGSGSPIAVGSGPRSIAVDPTGRFVYVGVEGASNITKFMITRPSGVLTQIGMPTPINFPSDLEVDPTGRFLLAVGDGDLISSFSIDSATGDLTFVNAGSPGTSARLLQIAPSGTTVYVARQTSGTNTAAFAINATTGSLSSIAGSPFTTGAVNAFSFAIDPNGKFLYIGDISGGEEIITNSINQSSGALSNSSTTLRTIGNILGVGIDVTGSFAYAGDQNSTSIFQFTIDPSTGILTNAGTSPGTGSGPRGVVTTGIIR